MKLATARLCLDCDEVHDEPQCPICGSESFAFLTRWVVAEGQRPASRRESAAAHTDPDRLEAYRALTAPPAPRRGAPHRLFGAAAGLATLGVAGWIWTVARQASRRRPSDPGGDR
jgi:hypothetical protein